MSAPCILVVDDNPTNLKLVCDILEFEGYRVLVASDAEEAMRIIQATTPDLILLDIALPGIDGLTFTRNLRAEEKTRHLLIVAVTAYAMKGDDEKARAAGCDGYITKPVNTRTLPALVADYLRRAPAPPAGRELRVLVVEDTNSDMKLAQHVLTAAGHKVVGAHAAQQALELIKQNSPQIVLLDLLLPDIDGLALVRALKADPDTSSIPIVAVTSYPELFPKQIMLEAGCDAYLVKPLDVHTLSGQLEEVVDRKSGA